MLPLVLLPAGARPWLDRSACDEAVELLAAPSALLLWCGLVLAGTAAVLLAGNWSGWGLRPDSWREGASGEPSELLLLLPDTATHRCWSLPVELSGGDAVCGVLCSCLCVMLLGCTEAGTTSWGTSWSISAVLWSVLHCFML